MVAMRARIMLVCVLALGNPLLAAEVAVPPELQPWQSWVLHGEEFRRCPFLTGNTSADAQAFQCAWPERLVLDLEPQGGRFTQRWQVFADSWVSLPGSLEQWPRDAQVNGARAAVVARNGVPQLRLTAGTYTISGAFRWSRRPEALPVPSQTGIVALTIDGQPIAQPDRPGSAVWLGKRRSAAEKPQMELQVYRLVSDGIPVTLTTRIQVQAAGEAREELLAPVLPVDFTALGLATNLPARLEPDGRLRVQVRAGSWEIVLTARSSKVAASLRRPQGEGPWARDEVWSFASNDRLRIATVEGVEGIDPVQANVPEEWRRFPAYRLAADSEMKIVERSRGLSADDENRLQLERQIWLDFNHEGYTTVDSIAGDMRQEWRLDVVAPYQLLSAQARGENLLVTKGAVSGATGIELRSPEVSVTAVSRIEAGSAMPATGWQARFSNVQGTLNLPPGHRLLAMIGADNAPGAWIERWRLLDMFLVLIASLAIGRLLGWRFGLLALTGLALTHHDTGGMIWLWVNLVVAILLARVAPEGRLRTVASVYRGIAAAAVLVMLIPFAADQARLAIYPQLDGPDYPLYPATAEDMVMMEAPASAPPESAREESEMMTNAPGVEDKLQSVIVTGSMARRGLNQAQVVQRYAPGTLVQTGPGTPDWQFKRYGYSWSGPVDPTQQLRFVIATPMWLSLWRLVGIVLLAALLVVLVRFAYGWPRQWPRIPGFGRAAAVLIAFAAIGLPAVVRAEMPDAALLGELKARLTRAPECAPSCAEVTAARVTARPQTLEIELEVSALAAVAIPVPAAQGRWEPESISVDGQTNGVLYRDAQQRLWVPLRAGAHELRLTGRIVAAESVQIVFPQQPRSMEAGAEGWEISGVTEGRLLTNTLELLRKGAAGPAARLEASMQFPTFVRVTRNIQLGLDWMVSTSVYRIAPQSGSFTVAVPLLSGESVLTEGIEARPDGTVLVAMPAGESMVQWTSGLARGETLQLAFPASSDRAEVWSFNVSPQWSVQFEGTPAVLPSNLDPSSDWSYEFYPRAGETLAVRVTRPEAVAGATLAFDSVALTAQIGKRSTNTSLELHYRSTQGGRHVLKLPEDARVSSVTVDGNSIPIRPQNGELPISLSPGSYVLGVEWESDSGVSVRSRAPEVDLGSPASNIRTQLTLPADRWSLYAFGPGVGPAILFWSELVVFVVLALLLGRLAYSPLKTQEWLLLGLGLSTFSWGVLLLFAVWMFAMRWRSDWQGAVSRLQFNWVQVALGLLSVIALFALVSAIPYGLLATPDMRVRGISSGPETFHWFVDLAPGQLPRPGVISVSLWWYKLAMLAWALWLSFALLRWLPWVWNAFRANGWWRNPEPRSAAKPLVPGG